MAVSQQLSDATYVNLLSLQKSLTMDMAATSPTVVQSMQTMGEPVVTKLICAVLKLFNDGLNTSLQMNARQLFEYATIWTEAFPHETIKDLILCLKRVKAGRYGPIYNRIDGTVISDFFRKYLDEKAEWGEQKNRQFISDQVKARNSVVASLPSEEAQQVKKLLRRSNVLATPDIIAPISSDKNYSEFLKQHAEEIPFDVLENVAQRAKSKNVEEVVKIVTTELDRRNLADSPTE